MIYILFQILLFISLFIIKPTTEYLIFIPIYKTNNFYIFFLLHQIPIQILILNPSTNQVHPKLNNNHVYWGWPNINFIISLVIPKYSWNVTKKPSWPSSLDRKLINIVLAVWFWNIKHNLCSLKKKKLSQVWL